MPVDFDAVPGRKHTQLMHRRGAGPRWRGGVWKRARGVRHLSRRSGVRGFQACGEAAPVITGAAYGVRANDR